MIEKQKYIDDLKKQEITKLFPYDCMVARIFLMKMLCESLDKNPQIILDEKYKKNVVSGKCVAAQPLWDFVIMYIGEFYNRLKKDKSTRIKSTKSSLEMPLTAEAAIRFRHRVCAHIDKKIKNIKDIFKYYDEINSIEGGTDKIFRDFLEYKDKLFEILEKV